MVLQLLHNLSYQVALLFANYAKFLTETDLDFIIYFANKTSPTFFAHAIPIMKFTKMQISRRDRVAIKIIFIYMVMSKNGLEMPSKNDNGNVMRERVNLNEDGKTLYECSYVGVDHYY